MHWIAPFKKDTANDTLEKRLCDTANHSRGSHFNSHIDDPHDATGRFDFVLANSQLKKGNYDCHTN